MRGGILRFGDSWIRELIGWREQWLQETKLLFATVPVHCALNHGLLSQAKTAGRVVLPALCLITASGASFGQAWVIEPSVQLQGQYDDNIRLATESPGTVFGTELSGEVGLSRLTEVAELRGFLRLEFVTYTGNDDNLRDEDNQFIGFSSLRRTELGQWSLDGFVVRDRTLGDVEVFLSPEGVIIDPDTVIIDPDDDIDVGLVEVNVRRNRLTLNPAWQYSLTERTDIQLGYRFNTVFYEDEQEADLTDFTRHQVTGSVFHHLTPVDRVRADIEAIRYRAPDEDREFDTYLLRAGIDRRFSETLRAGFSLGFRHTSFETPQEDGDESGYVVRVDGTQRTQFGQFNARLERNLSPSGSGEVVQSDQFDFRMTREISPRLGFSMRARFFQNKSLREGDSRNDRRYFLIEPELRWNWTRWLSIGASYRYRWQERDQDPDSVESNAVFVSLIYARPTALD